MAGLVAGRIDKDELGIRIGQNAMDTVPGGLRLVGGDADLLAHQGIGQRGFADVRSPDDGDETGAKSG